MLMFGASEHDSFATVLLGLQPISHGDIAGIRKELECAGNWAGGKSLDVYGSGH